MSRIIRKIISTNPLTKGAYLESRFYKPSELPRHIETCDVIGIKGKNHKGYFIDCYIKPDEAIALATVVLEAVEYYQERKPDCSLAPPIVIDGRGGSKHGIGAERLSRSMGLEAETDCYLTKYRRSKAVSAENKSKKEEKVK